MEGESVHMSFSNALLRRSTENYAEVLSTKFYEKRTKRNSQVCKRSAEKELRVRNFSARIKLHKTRKSGLVAQSAG